MIFFLNHKQKHKNEINHEKFKYTVKPAKAETQEALLSRFMTL